MTKCRLECVPCCNCCLLPGVTNDELAGRVGLLDSFEPESKDDFDKFGNLIRDKVTKYDVSDLSADVVYV